MGRVGAPLRGSSGLSARRQLISAAAAAVALSMLTGVPVVASMDPRIMEVLQGTFAEEAGPDGTGPKAKPNFGSVSKSAPEPTPAQARSS